MRKLVLVLVLCCFSALSFAEATVTTVGSGADAIPVIVVGGTPFEMGRDLGVALKKEATAFLNRMLAMVKMEDAERYGDAALDQAWASVSPYTDPRFKEELAGLAEGSGIPIEVMRRVHMIPVVSDYSCSGIAAWGAATRDGHLYQTRDLDWVMEARAHDYPCIVVYRPDEGIPHVNITFAGFIGANTGMNAEGITLSEMGNSPGREYPYDMNGAHFTTLFRRVFYDANNLDEALGIFRKARRIKRYHYIVGDGKTKQGVKVLAHAPDFVVWTDNDPKDEYAPRVLKNVVYEDEGRGAYEPLKEAYGKLDAAKMREIACSIPIRGSNVLDVIYDATALEFWVAYAEGDQEAYTRPFVHVKLRDYLE